MVSYLLSDAKFWSAVAFVIFILLTFKPVKSILIKQLDDKIDIIKSELNKAEKLKEDAQKILSEIQLRYNKLSDEYLIINERIDKKINEIKNNINNKFNNKVKRRKEQAEEKIKRIEQEAIKKIRDKTIDLTIIATQDLIKSKINSSLKNKLIEDSISDFINSRKN